MNANFRARGVRTEAHGVWTIFLPFLLLLTGCADWRRSPESGYGSGEPARVRAHESGEVQNTSSENAEAADSLIAQIQRNESALKTSFEVEQYAKVVPYFSSDRERLEFLNLKSFEQKQRWLNERHFSDRPAHIEEELKPLVESQDIKLGMPYALVKKSWGEPDFVETSGNPAFHNERWRYNRYASSPSGYKAEKKLVYFEGGRVAGWEVE